MKYDNQLRYAVNIIKEYDGLVPLSSWLKDYFRQHKQMGSHDRKTVASLVYGYYRLGHNSFNSIEERIIAGIYALNNLPQLKEYFQPAQSPVEIKKIFPWPDRLSEGIDHQKFSESFLQQPDVFVRMRPGFEDVVKLKLDQAGMPYTLVDEHGLCVANSTKIDAVVQLNKEGVIQDISSQRTGNFFKLIPCNVKEVWDCCAASGGKSIMANDLLPGIHITVSDKRKQIIDNLSERFQLAGMDNYFSFVADLTKKNAVLPSDKFDLVIADVPCSGSGTWSRTPEQLYFFKEERIAYYNELQKNIVSRVIPSMKNRGAFLYITCSVFREENEAVVEHILSSTSLRLIKMDLIEGYEIRADTLFAALFTS